MLVWYFWTLVFAFHSYSWIARLAVSHTTQWIKWLLGLHILSYPFKLEIVSPNFHHLFLCKCWATVDSSRQEHKIIINNFLIAQNFCVGLRGLYCPHVIFRRMKLYSFQIFYNIIIDGKPQKLFGHWLNGLS